jgi:EAL domain-containing protein (putative c-di-GMP-specific phosphodiesterase class I)
LYNDDWGHVKGDELLREFAARWREPLREVDLLARYGGDEFAVLLPGSAVDESRQVIQRLRSTTSALPSFSVGLAGWDGAETAEALMARADAALYNSKRAGPGRVTVLSTSHERVQSWSYLLPRLIASRDVDAIYQPIRRLDDFGLLGYEALARPTGFGVRSSVEDLFDAAKRLGFARDLDWLCRRAAVHSATSLPKNALLFINVSVHALLDPLHDVDQMLLLMRWAGRDPKSVIFEISERDQISDLDRLRGVLSSYRTEGFRFALDDVGEGYSTLEVLTGSSPEFIKVARSLSVGLDASGPRSAVQALVAFAASSGAQLIAEGLETDEHIRLVREFGIVLGQGYGVAMPRPSEQLAASGDVTPRVLRLTG